MHQNDVCSDRRCTKLVVLLFDDTKKQSVWVINGVMHSFHSTLAEKGKPHWIPNTFLQLSGMKFHHRRVFLMTRFVMNVESTTYSYNGIDHKDTCRVITMIIRTLVVTVSAVANLLDECEMRGTCWSLPVNCVFLSFDWPSVSPSSIALLLKWSDSSVRHQILVWTPSCWVIFVQLV